MNRKTTTGLILIFLSVFIIQCTGSKTLPPDLSGRWTTDDEAFSGEFIEISTGNLVFGSESEGSFNYRIKRVESEKGPIHNSTLFRITCTDESGEENTFSFIFSPEDGGTLRYKSSQDTLWKRS